MDSAISYKKIINLSLPIILGGIAQNIIMATDAFFMARVDEISLAAVGLAGLFFSTVYVCGLGFSIGVQILIARRDGEKNREAIGSIFDTSLIMLFVMSAFLWLIMELLGPFILGSLIQSPEVYKAAELYLDNRAWGITFALVNLAFRAFYIGVSSSGVIIWSTFAMAIANVFLNYALIFGEFGFPQMGIAGAAIASSLSELVALIWFIAHTLITKSHSKYFLFLTRKWQNQISSRIFSLASPVMFQYVISHAGWFLFFIIIEQISERALAISVIIRMIYMFQMVPFWGLSSATNTLVSFVIGEGRNHEVMPLLKKITFLAVISALPFVIINLVFPEQVLGLAIEDKTSGLLQDAIPTLYVMSFALTLFGLAITFYSGVTGSGNTRTALLIETGTICMYLLIAYILGIVLRLDVELIWLTEPAYFLLLGMFSLMYMKSNKWVGKTI
ncbi:MAG: MATE family efflux transporter [Bacteroidia bacterium]